MRTVSLERKTRETNVNITLNIDGSGVAKIDSGSGFFNHMLELFASHARFNITLKCAGDVSVDFHHSAEDIGICLGTALKDCLGEKRGIARYGNMIMPMDESLVLCAVDLSGRGSLNYSVNLRATRLPDEDASTKTFVGNFDTELVEEFLIAFARNAEITLHIKQLDGKNTHHIIEAVFKALGRALRQAVTADAAYSGVIPSTKGLL